MNISWASVSPSFRFIPTTDVIPSLFKKPEWSRNVNLDGLLWVKTGLGVSLNVDRSKLHQYKEIVLATYESHVSVSEVANQDENQLLSLVEKDIELIQGEWTPPTDIDESPEKSIAVRCYAAAQKLHELVCLLVLQKTSNNLGAWIERGVYDSDIDESFGRMVRLSDLVFKMCLQNNWLGSAYLAAVEMKHTERGKKAFLLLAKVFTENGELQKAVVCFHKLSGDGYSRELDLQKSLEFMFSHFSETAMIYFVINVNNEGVKCFFAELVLTRRLFSRNTASVSEALDVFSKHLDTNKLCEMAVESFLALPYFRPVDQASMAKASIAWITDPLQRKKALQRVIDFLISSDELAVATQYVGELNDPFLELVKQIEINERRKSRTTLVPRKPIEMQ